MHIVTGKVNIAVRKHKTGGHVYTAGQLRDAESIDKLIKFDDGYRVLKDLRGSPPYWEKAKHDLYAVIRQLGPAQLFVTLSAAETRWTHLLKILSEIVDGTVLTDEQIDSMTWSHKCRLISSDPVTCARHFDFCVKHFFNSFLKHPCSPFGEKDFWYRIEFQHRGSPHMHCLLWIADVPQYGVSDTIEVIQYIDNIITCQRSWDDEALDSLVERQLHRHTRSCKKQQRKTTVCRFGFPKYPMPQTEILEPLLCDAAEKDVHTANLKRVNAFLASVKSADESLSMDDFLASVQLDVDSYILAVRSSLKSAAVFVRRLPSELRVNNYNVHCLKAWQANHDIQLVLDVYACASYITAYVTKGSRGMSDLLRQVCDEARHGCSNLKQQVRIIGNKFLNNVEVTAQEAVYLLLQLPLKCCSREVVFINTNHPEERVYLLKSNTDQLADDAEVAESNIISRYSQRPKSLENVCLADYAAYYDNRRSATVASNSDNEFEVDDTTVTCNLQMPKRRKVARVIRTFQGTDDDAEKSARQKLMLYIPWRNEHSDLYGEHNTYLLHFQVIQSTLSKKISEFEPFKSEVNQAQELLETANLEQQWDLLVPGVQHSEVDAASAGAVESRIHSVINPIAHGQSTNYDLGIVDLGLGHAASEGSMIRYDMSDNEYFTLMKSLNIEQIQFVYDTIHHLKTSDQPIHRFLSGGAGTGKSYVLRAVRETMERFYRSIAGENYKQHWTMTLAPTGKAAFIVCGATIHSILHVPANQTLTYHRLDYESLNTLRSQISHVKQWLIDEISMVGHRMLSFIDQRLQEVNNTNRSFGGASVVVFGDLFQLPPVMDGFIFNDLSQSCSQVEQYSALAPNLWKSHFAMFELSTIMRQQDSRVFAELLNRVREGHHTEYDVELLHSRVTAVNSPDYPTCAQHLFRTNAQVEMHNISIFDNCCEQKYSVQSIDTVIGAISDDMASHILSMIPDDTRKTMQLAATLPLAVGCRYELCMNVNVSDGLANGAGGVIKHIHLTSSSSFNASGIVWMIFDDEHVGIQARADSRALYTCGIHAQWTPVQPLARQFQVGRSHNTQILRKQFPLRQSAAKTIHRSQGDTLDQVVVDFSSPRRQAHTHYVALSRVRTLDGLFILNLCDNKIKISNDVKQEMTVLRSDRKFKLSLPFPHLHQTFQVTFLNVRSLHKHIDLVRNDAVLSPCQIIVFCETRIADSDHVDMYRLDNFNVIMYPSHSTNTARPHYGLAVYSKLPVLQSCQPVSLADTYGAAECALVQVAVQPSVILSVACVYRRPSSDFSHFTTAMSRLKCDLNAYQSGDSDITHHTLIMGDFNLDWFDEQTATRMSSVLPNYRQLINEVTTDYGSALDHIYTDIPATDIQCYVGESYFSDHKPITVSIQNEHY